MLETFCSRCLAHSMHLSAVSAKGRECQMHTSYIILHTDVGLNLTLICVFALRCLSLTPIRQYSTGRDNLPETK
jgi:hypothetical protein